ncbi:MAG: hypothetical protein ACJA0U_003264 [Salibacteraceae bacterium]|jgi:hypothetical protein
MSTEKAMAGAYAVNVTIGNEGMPGAPIVELALVVVPSQNKVTGRVHANQATEHGDYTGTVEGTIYSTGLGKFTKTIAVKGSITPASGIMPIEIPFDANMAVDDAWNGVGGFNYLQVHVEDVPVKSNK